MKPSSVLDAALAALLGACLAVTLFAAGFGACCLRPTTQLLSQAASDFDASPYGRDQLTALAVATRDFTVDDYGRAAFGEEGARRLLNASILEAARASSAGDSPAVDEWRWAAAEVDFADPFASPEVTAETLARMDGAYALDADAFSHLQDCNELIRTATPALWIVAAAAGALLAALLLRRRHRAAGWALMVAPIALLGLLAALAIWAVADFQGLFGAFHHLFFPQGNWTFPADSLLIAMYPTAFWMGMGGVWLATTVLLSILSIVTGISMKKRA